jgi:hypothetical protein
VTLRIRYLPRRGRFVYPIEPAPRTALLVPWFYSKGKVRVFCNGWSEEVAKFAPEAVAATPVQLEALIASGVPSLRNAVIALLRPGERRLTDADRERLWRAFHVPVFEQIIGERNELLATECEAHDGLHVVSNTLVIEQHAGLNVGQALDTTPCACGRKSPRLVAAESNELVRSIAAYAR